MLSNYGIYLLCGNSPDLGSATAWLLMRHPPKPPTHTLIFCCTEHLQSLTSPVPAEADQPMEGRSTLDTGCQVCGAESRRGAFRVKRPGGSWRGGTGNSHRKSGQG